MHFLLRCNISFRIIWTHLWIICFQVAITTSWNSMRFSFLFGVLIANIFNGVQISGIVYFVICVLMLFIVIVMSMIETMIVVIVWLEYTLNTIKYVQRPFGWIGFWWRKIDPIVVIMRRTWIERLKFYW